MRSITLWKFAQAPNYSVNVDKAYPYSEVPFFGEYNLVKIPLSLNNLIEHVDYWGEGRIVTPQGVTGFKNCYNINLAYQLVSDGCDHNRKIPNRIPIASYTNCDTSAYIRDNSVLTVTVMGASINSSSAADIARIVNNDLGIVVAYGFESNSQDIANLTASLRDKAILLFPGYILPITLQELTISDSSMAFVNVNLMKDELLRLITNGLYTEAVFLTKLMLHEKGGDAIDEVIAKLLNSNSLDHKKLISYGYQLWENDAKSFLRDHFPKSFELIFGSHLVTIVNKGYNQALKLGFSKNKEGDRTAWGDDHDQTSRRVSWIFSTIWKDGTVMFAIRNVDCEMHLKLAIATDNIGDRKVFASEDADTDRHEFIMEPFVKNGVLAFYMINYKYGQGLKLGVNPDEIGDRLLWGHNGDIYKDEDRFMWIISEW